MGSASAPTFWDTRAAIGTADTPAEPISGLIFPPVILQRSLPKSTPPMVPKINAVRPRATILMVVTFKNASALVVAPTEVPSRITTIYIRALLAVSASCFTTPLSRNRLPNISIPTRGAVDGRIRHTTMVTMMGNRIFSSLDTGRSCSILILRSFSVVRSFINGGWMIGTSAM